MQMSHLTASPERVVPSSITEYDKPDPARLQQYESRVSMNAFDALNNSLLPDEKEQAVTEKAVVLDGNSSMKHTLSCHVDEETYYAQQVKDMRIDLDCLN